MPEKNKLDDDLEFEIVDNPKNDYNPIPLYEDLLDKHRRNKQVPGFPFDVDTFENLIDNYTPYDDIPVILGTNIPDLDQFCFVCYGMKYKETYRKLQAMSDVYMRKVIKNLAASGNNTALNIAAKHFLELKDEEDKKAISVTFVNDLPQLEVKEVNDDDR